MTKKDYIVIAEALRTIRKNDIESGIEGVRICVSFPMVVNRIINELKMTNERFDSEKFWNYINKD